MMAVLTWPQAFLGSVVTICCTAIVWLIVDRILR